ncbi:putative peptidase [compost metagenome]
MNSGIKEFVAARIARLREYMAANRLEAVIVTKPENTFYFSNFNPVLNSHPLYMVIPLQGEPCLLVHCIRYSHALEEGCIGNVQCYGQWGGNPSLAASPVEAIAKLLGDSVRRAGLELDDISVSFFNQLCVRLGVEEPVNLSKEISMMKLVKDPYEISCIRKAAHLVDTGVEAAIAGLRSGLTEAEACTEGQYSMRRLWHSAYPDMEVCGFGTSEGGMIDSLHVWSLANEHIAYGCDVPRHYKPRPGDIALPMAWAKVGGYHAENERTLVVGKLEGKREAAYQAMLEARAAIFRILKPGVLFEELFIAAADVFTAHGFMDILPGRVGHGIGNSGHEFPSLAKGNMIPLEPGMVITVEPGLMDKGWGGARHSDTVLITQDGYEQLTKLENGRIVI